MWIAAGSTAARNLLHWSALTPLFRSASASNRVLIGKRPLTQKAVRCQ